MPASATTESNGQSANNIICIGWGYRARCSIDREVIMSTFKKLSRPYYDDMDWEMTHKCMSCDQKTGWDNGNYIECVNCLADNREDEDN